VLGGGSTLFEGLVPRLQKELAKLIPHNKIIAPEDRIYSVWQGGSILANLSKFRGLWLKKTDYEEGLLRQRH